MVNVLDKDKILWYVMRAYKNENTAEDRLSNETYGLEYFIPKQKVLRTVKGKKVFFMVPVIHSLVFVHASHQKIVDFKHNYYYDLQFVTWKSGGELVYLTVPDEDMTNFIKVCKQADEEVHFYKISDDFIIGDVFALRENEDTYNVGWHFNKRFEGKGFACEAAAGLLDYLFREAGARRIYGFVEDDNIRSKRLCERLGMRREGCFKEFVTFVNNPDGSPKYEDTCVYAILEKEWNTIRQW